MRSDRRTLRTLRTTCARIPVPQPFDLDEFFAGLALLRQRPVEVRDLPAAACGTMTGAWVALRRLDLVFIDPGASAWHRNVIGLHEAAHMLCDHDTGLTVDYDMAGRLAPDIEPAAIRQILGRSGCSGTDERDTELVASLLLARADTGPSPAIARTDAVTARLSEALHHPVRHV
jgi:hypothetical protein